MSNTPAIDEWIVRLEGLPQALLEEAARETAASLEAELKASIAAGTTPEGVAWKPRQSDGGKALQHAADALTVEVDGTTVTARITGVEARHHRGWVKGGVQRRILPARAELSPRVVAKVAEAIARRLQEVMTDGA